MTTQKNPRRFALPLGHGRRLFLAASAVLATQFPSNALANESQKLDAFAAKIEHAMQNRCVGFGYAIYKNGSYVRGGGGGAREKVDSIYGDHPFNQNTQKDCHSMSKTIDRNRS